MSGRHEELIAGWLDASLTPAERDELLEALRADADVARAFAEEVEIHRGLQFSASRSAEGDRRAADRILHFVRASQEETRFAEGVKLRAMSGGRRPPGGSVHRGTSLVGPVIAAAAALMVAALVGLMALASHRQKTWMKQETAESREAAKLETELHTAAPEIKLPVDPKKADIDQAKRKEQVEEDLRRAVGSRPNPDTSPPAKPGNEKPASPDEKPRPADEAPAVPEKATRVEAAAGVARIESVQGSFDLHYGGEPGGGVAAGTELRDGAELTTNAAESSVVIRCADGTRLEYSNGAGSLKINGRMTGKRATGRGVTLSSGTLLADVAKQPPGQSFLFLTPHAEVQVLGTKLMLEVPLLPPTTHVEVKEGQVRVTSLKTSQAVTLSAGQGAEVGTPGAVRSAWLGLHATYFDQNTFKGSTFDRVEAGVDLVLDQAKNELPPIGQDRNFGVRWEGQFLAELPGEYAFFLSVDGRVRFLLDGQEVFADPRDTFHGMNRTVVRKRLTPGWHDFLIEYCDDQGSSRCVLRFAPPGSKVDERGSGEPGTPIPPRLFTHTRK